VTFPHLASSTQLCGLECNYLYRIHHVSTLQAAFILSRSAPGKATV